MGLTVEGKVLLSSDPFPEHGAPLWLLAVRAGYSWAVGIHVTAEGLSFSHKHCNLQREPGEMVLSLHCKCRHG